MAHETLLGGEKTAANTFADGFPIPRLVKPASGGAEVNAAHVLGDGKVKLLYFGASWCGPCQQFSPELDAFAGRNAKDVSVVYVGQDRDQASFEAYSSKWQHIYSVPFADLSVREALASKYGVWALPTVQVVSPNGVNITSWGRAAVSSGDACVAAWKEGKSGVSFCSIT